MNSAEMQGLKLIINGVVQGVGFRPFVFGLAKKHHLTGWVKNTSAGVITELNGTSNALTAFMDCLERDLPPLARIDSIEKETIPAGNHPDFQILSSEKITGKFSLVPPDAAICPECSRELFDPSNRRYRYPFINCTNCGPRFTIIQEMPYDRAGTTMSGFQMCPECQAEYDNPLDRRFHAQPIACEVCGPHVELIESGHTKLKMDSAIQRTRQLIREGKIIAIKGLGGFLLACDAYNSTTIETLRFRKHRSDKALALMAYDLATIRKYCHVSPEEEQMLTSPQMPIVILKKKSNILPDACAPGQDTIGFMLPYTPLHLLLCEPEADFPEVLVMTSANKSDNPAIHEDIMYPVIESLSDALLTHNRPIQIRADDSVTRLMGTSQQMVRRSRGYTPEPIKLPVDIQSTLAYGARLKNTFTFTHLDKAYTSPFIGDLEFPYVEFSYRKFIKHFEYLYQFSPSLLACDLHPDFMSTDHALKRKKTDMIPLIQVQHHHAHLSACLAENGWMGEKAIGLIFDGTGLGTDGMIWGGEILVGGYASFERSFHLSAMPIQGGHDSFKSPARIAVCYLHAAGLPMDERIVPVYNFRFQIDRLIPAIEKNINVFLNTSMGRLFDAVSALANVRQVITYEGQAAIELEAIAADEFEKRYEYQINGDSIDVPILIEQVYHDSLAKVAASEISAKFHNTIAAISVELCRRIRESEGINEVALSGGVWQNARLQKQTLELLKSNEFIVYTHTKLPFNDGCISLGQAVSAGMMNKLAISR